MRACHNPVRPQASGSRTGISHEPWTFLFNPRQMDNRMPLDFSSVTRFFASRRFCAACRTGGRRLQFDFDIKCAPSTGAVINGTAIDQDFRMTRTAVNPSGVPAPGAGQNTSTAELDPASLVPVYGGSFWPAPSLGRFGANTGVRRAGDPDAPAHSGIQHGAAAVLPRLTCGR